MQLPTIIPAQPGYFLLTPTDPAGYSQDPVVAWAIRSIKSGECYANPISLEEGERDDTTFDLLRPDGRVVRGMGDRVWDSVQEWRDERGLA